MQRLTADCRMRHFGVAGVVARDDVDRTNGNERLDVRQ